MSQDNRSRQIPIDADNRVSNNDISLHAFEFYNYDMLDDFDNQEILNFSSEDSIEEFKDSLATYELTPSDILYQKAWWEATNVNYKWDRICDIDNTRIDYSKREKYKNISNINTDTINQVWLPVIERVLPGDFYKNMLKGFCQGFATMPLLWHLNQIDYSEAIVDYTVMCEMFLELDNNLEFDSSEHELKSYLEIKLKRFFKALSLVHDDYLWKCSNRLQKTIIQADLVSKLRFLAPRIAEQIFFDHSILAAVELNANLDLQKEIGWIISDGLHSISIWHNQNGKYIVYDSNGTMGFDNKALLLEVDSVEKAREILSLSATLHTDYYHVQRISTKSLSPLALDEDRLKKLAETTIESDDDNKNYGRTSVLLLARQLEFDMDLFEKIIQENNNALNYKSANNSTLLHEFCQNSNIPVDAIKKLIEYGVDVNAASEDGYTALDILCTNYEIPVETFEFLLEKMTIDGSNEINGLRLLQYYCCSNHRPKLSVIEFLINRFGLDKDKSNFCVLYFLCNYGNPDTAVLDYCINTWKMQINSLYEGGSVLHRLFENGKPNINTVDYLITKYKLDINVCDSDGDDLLTAMLRFNEDNYRSPHAINYLLQHMDINLQDDNGRNVMHRLSGYGFNDVICKLLDSEKLNYAVGKDNKTYLHIYCESDEPNLNIINKIIVRFPQCIFEKDINGETFLDILAKRLSSMKQNSDIDLVQVEYLQTLLSKCRDIPLNNLANNNSQFSYSGTFFQQNQENEPTQSSLSLRKRKSDTVITQSPRND